MIDDREIDVQMHGIHKTENNKNYIPSKNRKVRTSDIKCYAGINATSINKTTKIKMNKNNNNSSTSTQTCCAYKNEKIEYMKIEYNKIIINDTKCHFEINVIYINKSIRIRINKNNNKKGK
jgi:hypothetical protein